MENAFGLINVPVNHIRTTLTEGEVIAAFGNQGWADMMEWYTVGDNPDNEEVHTFFNNSEYSLLGAMTWAPFFDDAYNHKDDVPF